MASVIRRTRLRRREESVGERVLEKLAALQRLDASDYATDWGAIASCPEWRGERGLRIRLELLRQEALELLALERDPERLTFLQAKAEAFKSVIDLPETMLAMHRQFERSGRQAAAQEERGDADAKQRPFARRARRL